MLDVTETSQVVVPSESLVEGSELKPALELELKPVLEPVLEPALEPALELELEAALEPELEPKLEPELCSTSSTAGNGPNVLECPSELDGSLGVVRMCHVDGWTIVVTLEFIVVPKSLSLFGVHVKTLERQSDEDPVFDALAVRRGQKGTLNLL